MEKTRVIGFAMIVIGILAVLGAIIFVNDNTLNRADNIPFSTNWVHVIGFLLISAGAVFLLAFGRKKGD